MALRHVYEQPPLSSSTSVNPISVVLQAIGQVILWLVQHLSGAIQSLGPVGVLLAGLVGAALAAGALVVIGRHVVSRRRDLHAESDLVSLTTDPETEWAAAEAAAGRSDYREAVRRGFRSVLLALALHGRTWIDPSWTTRELLTNVAADSDLERVLRRAGRRFELAWYARQTCGAEEWAAAREEYLALRRLARHPRREVA